MGSRSHYEFSAMICTLLLASVPLSCTPINGPNRQSSSQEGATSRARQAHDASQVADIGDADPGESAADQQLPMHNAVMRSPNASTPASNASSDAGGMQRTNPEDMQAAADASAPADSTPGQRPERSRDELPLNQTEIPAETADAEALEALSQWDKLPVFASVRRQHANSSDRGKASSTDSRLMSIYEDGNRDLNNFICRSKDAKVGTPSISYIFDLDRCQDDYVHGVELARFEGSGRMTRLWFSAGTPTNSGLTLSDEMLRIYVDDNPRPLLQVRLSDAVTGVAGEIFATPFGSAAKNSMAWYYPVVFSSKLVLAIDNLYDVYFYEVEAVVDEQPRQRWAPLERLPERDAAHARLATPSPRSATDKNQKTEHLSLGAGELAHVTLDGPTTTNELRLRVPTAKLAGLQPLTISVKWDKNDGNAIDVPLLGLFAARVAPPERNTLALAATLDANDTVLSLRLPMPFQTIAEWTVTNTGAERVELDLTWIGAAGVPANDFGNLHVQTFDAMLPASKVEQAVAQISSRGRLVGVCFDIAGDAEVSTVGDAFARPLLFSSGDLDFTIDGQSSTFATSTETYNDDAFYFIDAPRSTAFTQSWNLVADAQKEPQGQVSLCRWHVLGNEVDFAQELKVTRELAQRDPSYVKLHRSIAYYYAH